METTVVLVFAVVHLGMMLGGLPFLSLDRTGIALLGVIALVVIVAALSAVFSNDVICLAMAPVLIDVCLARRLNSILFLRVLACSANVGSALTLIGNPQNMRIGEKLQLPFSACLLEALDPVILRLAVVWGCIAWRTRGAWELEQEEAATTAVPAYDEPPPQMDRRQTAKGLGVAAVVFALFLAAPFPREVVALTAAGVLMMSRKLHSHKMLGLVDWQLLVLFVGLFVVNHALDKTGLTQQAVAEFARAGIDLHQPGPLFVAAFVLSNIVSNVPAVMLLLPVATHALGGPLLALASTLAGNLLIVGSIANIIVVDVAARRIENHGANHVPAFIGKDKRVYGILGELDVVHLKREVSQGASAVERATGAAPRWYRGATGEYDNESLKVIEQMGYRVAGFSVNADSGASLSRDRIVRRLKKVRSGDIVIAHVKRPPSDTAEGLVIGLKIPQEQGFRFVKLNDFQVRSLRPLLTP